jgi:hypothetical protein
MARYVCPMHEDVILFDDSAPTNTGAVPTLWELLTGWFAAGNVAPALPIIPAGAGPEQCPKCDKSYYRRECRRME